MKPVLLIDFGSTYTKVSAVDIDSETLLGTAQSFTTIETDINDGLTNALIKLEKAIGKIDFKERYACSSAAGGLKIVSVGLVPELTAEAAKMASLGAGGKVLKVFSYELNSSDIEQIENLSPEIVLLVGGTDGGNSKVIIHNAEVLSKVKGDFAIIFAGNRNCTDKCLQIISDSHKVYTCENVMPKFNQLNIGPVQNLIRDIFLERIISAKGLSEASDLVSGIVNPTPAAVMRGITLLADGCPEEKGIGELLAVDVGGATTDVYSICKGSPTGGNTVLKGLPEPYAKRTVEGDIGMRYSIGGIVDASTIDKISQFSSISVDDAKEMIDHLSKNTEEVPTDEKWERLDFALASCAIDVAVDRHAGHLEEIYTAMGITNLQVGKDLGNVHNIVVTGGSLIHTSRTDEIAANSLCSLESPNSLRPKRAHIFVDRDYIIASMGLLAEHYPTCALRILKSHLCDEGEKICQFNMAICDKDKFNPMMSGGCHIL